MQWGAAVATVGLAMLAGTRPSDRGCLVAWNGPGNHVNRARLVAARPTGLELRSGSAGVDRWSKGTAVTATSTDACLLTVRRRHTAQLVVGAWRAGRVTHWSWLPVTPPPAAFLANVRLLPDGRVTKMYRR